VCPKAQFLNHFFSPLTVLPFLLYVTHTMSNSNSMQTIHSFILLSRHQIWDSDDFLYQTLLILHHIENFDNGFDVIWMWSFERLKLCTLLSVWRDLCQALLRSDFWLAMDKRRSLRRVTEQSLVDYIDNFYNGVFIEGLIQGNVTAKVGLVSDLWYKIHIYVVQNLSRSRRNTISL